jgi:hypothetical protein
MIDDDFVLGKIFVRILRSKVSASGIWIFEIEIFYTILRVKYSITYEASYVNGMSNT